MQLGSGRRVMLACGILVLLAALPYLNSLGNSFVWDDQQQIIMNPQLRAGADWSPLFSAGVWAHLHKDSPGRNIYYRPLQMATYRAVIAVSGISYIALHLMSVGFAVVSVFLTFALFQQLSDSTEVAFAAAALFAVHPVHTEAVDWISALPDIGCAVFVLAALLLFLLAYRTASPSSWGKWLAWSLSLACFACALLWKETAAVSPLLVAAYVFLFSPEPASRSRVRSAILWSLPFWAVLGGYLLLRLHLLGSVATTQRAWQLSALQIAMTLPWLMTQYWWKLLVPAPLNAYHVFVPVESLNDVRAIVGLLFLGGLLAILIYTWRRFPATCFSVLWVVVTLLPVMNIYAVGRNVFAERYLYLPSVGFCLMVALVAAQALQRVPERRRRLAGSIALAIVVSLFGGMTFARNTTWKDNATLFGKTLERSPNAPFVQVMVAAAQTEDDATSQEGERHYRKAANDAGEEVPPDRVNMGIAYKGLAAIYSARAEYDRGLEMLTRAREAHAG